MVLKKMIQGQAVSLKTWPIFQETFTEKKLTFQGCHMSTLGPLKINEKIVYLQICCSKNEKSQNVLKNQVSGTMIQGKKVHV
jgi:hypothetical protein